jgi:hypothetical protein
MKNSEKYHAAMIAVLAFNEFSMEDTLEILEVLMDQRNLAEFVEEHEAKEALA